jgi:hypothetical protein
VSINPYAPLAFYGALTLDNGAIFGPARRTLHDRLAGTRVTILPGVAR